jgi:serine/threonine protein kinase
MLGCARGLAQCHAVDLLHRDFEPWNILFDAYYRPTVIDFGFSKKLSKVR